MLTAFNAAPGYHISGITRDDRQFAISGLRDPLADSVATVTDAAGLPRGAVVEQFEAFQSLDPEIVRRRAEAALNAPASVSVARAGDTLVLT